MKKYTLLLFTFIIFYGCSSKKQITKDLQKSKVKTFQVTSGTINWRGEKIAYQHSGTLDVASGTFAVEGNKIISGDFLININSIKNTDLKEDPDKQGKLIGHLKSPDFFDIAKFPTATFSITSVKETNTDSDKYVIEGNLTMLGITKSVSFPVLSMQKVDGTFQSISDKFTIKRTDWGMDYATIKAGVIRDKAINDEVVLQINISAKELL